MFYIFPDYLLAFSALGFIFFKDLLRKLSSISSYFLFPSFILVTVLLAWQFILIYSFKLLQFSFVFFSFPINDKNRLKKCTVSVKRKNIICMCTKSNKICSDHFLQSHYLLGPGKYVKPSESDTIPFVFNNFPSYH